MGEEGDSWVNSAGVEEANVNIRCSNGSKFSVKTSLESTVAEFRGLLAQSCDIAAEQQRLVYKGRILKDDQTLASYGLQADHTVHVVRGSAPSATPPSTAPASTANTGRGVAAAQGGGSPITGGAGVAGAGASLFPGLGGAFGGTRASGLFGARLPESEQLLQNHNVMRDIMNSPGIQSLVNNPEIMRNLIMSNPQMREIIDRNPEIAHVLNDPSILRQTLEAVRNPEIMREMMRNNDRAMSNIESSPEGFNMLRRMYENVKEPFLKATRMVDGAATDAGSNPFASRLGNLVGSQARDGSNSSGAGPQMTTGTTIPNATPLPNPWNNTGGSQTNNVTRTNPSGNATLPFIAGLGVLGLPEMEHMWMPDASKLNQLLQNPAVSQMMQRVISEPQYMDQILSLNPQLRSMLDANPQLREMMQNPEVLRELTSPAAMQQMINFQRRRSQFIQQLPPREGSQIGLTKGNQNDVGVDMLINMFGGLGAGSLTGSNAPNVPPEELYAAQLSQLQEMGFVDTQENIRALQATAGDVHAAVERLVRK